MQKLTHFPDLFCKRIQQKPYYHYSDEIVQVCSDVFHLYILDGGAFACSNQMFRTDRDQDFGNVIIDSLEKGILFRPWLKNSVIDWDLMFNMGNGSQCRSSVEQHVWLNRLYFLLPIAWKYYQTHNPHWSDQWWHYFGLWLSAHPYDNNWEKTKTKGNYVWYDMQVTWRVLVMIHSLFLLKESTISRENQDLFCEALKMHVKHLLAEITHELNTGSGKGNHYLQKGMALLFCGILCPDLVDVDDCIKKGTVVIEHQLANEILEDGSSIEASPSYSHFIARMYLDVFLLLQNNKMPPISGLRKSVEKQYDYLYKTMAPDDKTLVFNDSYSMDARRDFSLCQKLYPLSFTSQVSSVKFSAAKTVILRKDNIDLFVNGSSTGLEHLHPGNPSFVAYYKAIPLLWEAGICNYDLDMRAWHRAVNAHNSVTVSTEDNYTPSFEDFKRNPPLISIDDFQKDSEKSSVVYTHTYNSSPLSYNWKRIITVAHNKIVITDQLKSEQQIRAEQYTHLCNGNVYRDPCGSQVYGLLEQYPIVLTNDNGNPLAIEHNTLLDNTNRYFFSPTVVQSASGTAIDISINILINEPLSKIGQAGKYDM